MAQEKKNHVIEKLKQDKGFVLVLDTGADIDAQAEAMLLGKCTQKCSVAH